MRRARIVQNLFASSFHDKQIIESDTDKITPEEIEQRINAITENREAIDGYISKYAPKYPLDRIAKVDLSILRLAVYELAIEKKEPTKVVIDEAVTLAREYGGDRSYAFINAVLGSVYNELFPDQPKKPVKLPDTPDDK